MKTAHVPLIPAFLLLSAALAWGGALHGQEVQPRQAIKVDPKLLDTYVGQYQGRRITGSLNSRFPG